MGTLSAIKEVYLKSICTVYKAFERMLSVTSGGRCPYHKDESKRTTPADHQKGTGIDLAVNGLTRGNVVQAGIKAGCNAIGVAKTFVHLGYRKELPSGHITIWTY